MRDWAPAGIEGTGKLCEQVAQMPSTVTLSLGPPRMLEEKEWIQAWFPDGFAGYAGTGRQWTAEAMQPHSRWPAELGCAEHQQASLFVCLARRCVEFGIYSHSGMRKETAGGGPGGLGTECVDGSLQIGTPCEDCFWCLFCQSAPKTSETLG